MQTGSAEPKWISEPAGSQRRDSGFHGLVVVIHGTKVNRPIALNLVIRTVAVSNAISFLAEQVWNISVRRGRKS